MKKLLLLSLVLWACEMKSQDISKLGLYYTDSINSKIGISYYKDIDSIMIHGDTIKNIKMLLGFIDDARKRESDLWNVVFASKSYFNSMPAYFTDYKNYKQALVLTESFKKLEFTITRRKYPR